MAVIIFISVTASAQLSTVQFGKNKVQYQSFEWRYITSPHFDVYFHDSLSYLATFCAYKAEDALASLIQHFGYRPTKRLRIIIYGSHNQFQQTNVIGQLLPEGVGGVTELFKNRMVLPYEGDWDKFRHVIHHELVHAYLNEMFYGGTIQYALMSQVSIPLWMNEGLAEFESLDGLDTQTDMFMRDLALSQELRPLDQLNGYLAYRGGQAFYAYIERQYGRNKVAELIHKLRNSPTPSAAFEATFGKTLQDFSDEWVNAMKKMYWPDLDRFVRLDEFAQRLTDHTKDDNYYYSSPAISPDGQRVAFLSDRDGDFGIYVMELSTKKMTKLIGSGRSLDFEELNILTPGISWNPSGTKLSITAKSGGEDALYIVDARSGDYEKFTAGLPAMASAAWSPDGRYIAIEGVRAEQPDLYLFDVERKTFVQLTDDLFNETNPTWSPDGAYIYFVSERGEHLDGQYTARSGFTMWSYPLGSSDIYRIAITNGIIERITDEPNGKKSSLAISHDGQRLLYVSDANGIGNLYLLDLESRRSYPLTNTMSGLMQLSLARDDSKLIFAAQNRVGYDLFMIRNPFELSRLDSLPLTKFKLAQIEQQAKLRRIVGAADSLRAASRATFVGYGAFEIEFPKPIVRPASEEERGQQRLSASSDVRPGYDLTPRPYKVSISNDLLLSTGGYNTLWGSLQGVIQMLFSDIMGDHQIFGQVALWQDLRNTFFYFQYAYLPGIIDYLGTANQFSTIWVLPDSWGGYSYNLLRTYGAGLDAVYAWTTFQRVELGLRWVGIERENLQVPTDPGYSANYLVPSIRYIYDDTDFGILAPYRGIRANIGADFSPLTKPFTLFTADVRWYIPVYRYLYGAMIRFAGGVSTGGAPRRFHLGGAGDNWFNRAIADDATLFFEPEDLAFLQLAMPLRGFALGQESGTRYLLLNAEWRFPIFYALAGGPVPISIGGLLGCLFFDIGTAWSGNEVIALRPPQTIYSGGETYTVYPSGTIMMSCGIGLRTVLAGFPLKIDIAWRYDGQNWSVPWWLFSIGLDL
ncbi:MAG: BamA/TamA family outer membrane protein [Chlorobi bacterium]|nr:BamA/TamA family outer membrane protein [Chlorobiota bacterium]